MCPSLQGEAGPAGPKGYRGDEGPPGPEVSALPPPHLHIPTPGGSVGLENAPHPGLGTHTDGLVHFVVSVSFRKLGKCRKKNETIEI